MSTELDVDITTAMELVDDTRDAVDDGARQVVEQLTVLAEGAMKAEAPEGGGRETHMRDTITTTFEDGGMTGRVRPTKTTASGIPLVDIVTGDPGPWAAPPPLAPLADWTDAKFGDPEAAFGLQQKIFQDGIDAFPNPFVSRSINRWTGDVEDVAGDEVASALSRAGVMR